VTSEIEKIAKWTKDDQINENSYFLYNQVNLLDEFSGGDYVCLLAFFFYEVSRTNKEERQGF